MRVRCHDGAMMVRCRRSENAERRIDSTARTFAIVVSESCFVFLLNMDLAALNAEKDRLKAEIKRMKEGM